MDDCTFEEFEKRYIIYDGTVNHYGNSILNFGKYKGKFFIDVLEQDEQYIWWMVEHVPNFETFYWNAMSS